MSDGPDIIGNSLSRARQRLEAMGITLAALHPVKPPADWKPPVPHNFDVEPYVVGAHFDREGKNAVLDVVVAWKPRRPGDKTHQLTAVKKKPATSAAGKKPAAPAAKRR